MGNVSRLQKDYPETETLRIFRLLDQGRLTNNKTEAFMRPAYQHTKAEVGEVK